MGKNIGKNICKKLSSKCGQKRLYHAKQSATEATESSSKRIIQKTEETTGDLTGNKIVKAVAEPSNAKITKVSKNSQQNNLDIVPNENDKERPKERCMSPEK